MSSDSYFRLVKVLVSPPAPALCPSSLRDAGEMGRLEMAVARTTETKHQWRCHYFGGCGKWSVCLVTVLWLPGALFQGRRFGIFILTKPFVVKCAQVWQGSEGQWAMPQPQPHVNSGIAAPSERFILICSWLRAGLWWLFPGDFQPELQGAQAPAHAHTEGRDGYTACMSSSLLQEVDKGSQNTELVGPWASVCFPECQRSSWGS